MENALVRLVQAVDTGDWYEIDLAMELAKEALGFDPTRLVQRDDNSDCSIEDPCDQCKSSLN